MPRTREEVARDLEGARRELDPALRETIHLIQARCDELRSRVVTKAGRADGVFRSHVYSILGAAIAAGGLAGLLMARKRFRI